MNSEIPEPRFLSAPKAAKICGVSRNTVYMWVKQGKLSAYQTPGNTNLIRPTDLLKFMQKNGMFVPESLHRMAEEDNPSMINEPAIAQDNPEEEDTRIGMLVVDDDSACRKISEKALAGIGKVYQAETGFEALHLLTKHKNINIVLLDLRMPGQHGYETISEIKSMNPNIKIIIQSGFVDNMPEELLSCEQVKKILKKPVSIQQLQETIKEVLGPVS